MAVTANTENAGDDGDGDGDGDGGWRQGGMVLVETIKKDTVELPHTSFAKVRNSGGFGWGHMGVAATALAHSILAYEYDDENIADEFFYIFTREIIARLPVHSEIEHNWSLTTNEIQSWLNTKQVIKTFN